MTRKGLYFFLLTAVFLSEPRCSLLKTSTGAPLSPVLIHSSGEAGGKRDNNQTYFSRLKRKTLSVDFAIPSLFRTYLSELIKRPLNGECLEHDVCYTVRSNLRLHCAPLQKTVSSFLDSKLRAPESAETQADNSSDPGQLPYTRRRPLSRVLNLGLSKVSRKSNQVVIEIGEKVVRAGCGGLRAEEDGPSVPLEMDLSRMLEWWLGAEGGRLRVRLMPERRAQIPGREESYSAAIRAADPRLILQIASRGSDQTAAGDPGDAPGLSRRSHAYWNFTWASEDELQFPLASPQPELHCPDRRPCAQEDYPEFSWSITQAQGLWSDWGGWEEGQFLLLNGSGQWGPWALSPWLWRGGAPCALELAVFLHPQQSGRYTVRLVERHQPPRTILRTDAPRRAGWALVRLALGLSWAPFRISAEYSGHGGHGGQADRDTAALDPRFFTNCTSASPPSPRITLQGRYRCRSGPDISLGQMCDFQTDCPHGDDEGEMCRQFHPGSYCSFEEGDCGWQTTSLSDVSWVVLKSQPGGATDSCASTQGAVLVLHGGEAAELRSPLFPPPLRNAPCQVRFRLCQRGHQQRALSLWVVENGTGLEEKQRVWQSGGSTQGWGWSLVSLPLYGVTDWFWLQFSADRGDGFGPAITVDNISLSPECFLASNGDLPPQVTPVTVATVPPEVTNEHLMIDPPEEPVSDPVSMENLIFSTCGATGSRGPTPTQCSNAYRHSKVNVTVVTEGPLRGVQIWRIPATGDYRITGYGAAGGRSVEVTERSHGVYVVAEFLLQKDELLYILVGQQGEDACPNPDPAFNQLCLGESSLTDNKTRTMTAGGGGGGGGATYVFKVVGGVPVPLLIAAGAGGRGYSSGQSKDEEEEELLETDPSVPGQNGRSGAAGGGGGWNDTSPVPWAGQPLVLGALGGQPCPQSLPGWKTRGGFGGGGGACSAGGGGGGYIGGSTSQDDDPTEDGGDGVSFISPEGKAYLMPLKVMESHGEVLISMSLNCSHCESGECRQESSSFQIECFCEPGKLLAPDRVSCLNATEIHPLNTQPHLSELALGLSVGTSALIAALLLTVSAFMIMYRRKHTELQSIQLELQSPDCKLSKLRTSTIMTDYNPNYCFAGKTTSVTDLKEVPRRNISLTRGLGHGAFGEVYEGLAVGIPGEPSPMQVAVKTLPEVCSEQDELDFLMEALIISKFSHQNIVRCIGVSLQALPRFILLELMAGGDLKTFLRETRPRLDQPSSLSMVDLLNVARDIARGCQYLEENHFIHRDIAARNCLLTCKGPGRVAKIGDFGMARDIYRASYYRKGGRAMLPVKWMPPEAFMEGIFTSKTDTWSFGVLLWEIFSLGYMPYPSRSNQEVLEFVTNGGRMDPPKNCPGPVYRIMTQSWQHQPEDRPNFSTILERIDYCLQDPDVVNMPLPVEYGPAPEEEEKVPMRPEDPGSTPSLLVSPQALEGGSGQEERGRDGGPYLQPTQQSQQSQHSQQPAPPPPSYREPEGGHVNLAFSQGQPPEREPRNGKHTSLWNPTYGSWYLEQKQRQRACGEGQERGGRTVEEAAGAGAGAGAGGQQHQAAPCRPLMPPPPPPPPPAPPNPLLLEPSALPPAPLFRLRRFPCGNIGYGYQERGLPLEPPSNPPPPPQRPAALGRTGTSEDSRPLLVPMATTGLQDPRLTKVDGHSATVL
ncbi:ALK tyrosine kinase receptor isoform X2 [Lepisosteus oculatus]|uniref:ALK tyrosine kinase receptor isoform X2 n=1 Tax=Lepisosteus oculatus TaxID=7918 RepID=UPI0035F5221B